MSTAIEGTTDWALEVLNPADLNLVVIDLIWGDEAVDELVSQYAVLGITDPAELGDRRSFAGLAPVAELPVQATTAAPRRQEGELRAA